jgi:hypothetical protein
MATYQYDETQEIIDREYLGKIARARYEAESWLQLHSADYFATPQNGAAMTRHMQENGLPLTAENFEIAYEQLKASGELLPGREAVARMSADEVKEFARQNGRAVFDGHGRLMGYDLPPAYSASSEGYNRPAARYTQDRLPAHPGDVNRNPSRAEFASWSADRAEDWLKARGYWGQNLPDFLR